MKKILIIDDNQNVRDILKTVLSRNGYEVLIAADGFQGLKYAHRQRPDLIILDLLIPAGGGMSVYKNLRMSTHINQIPIVVFSDLRDEDLKVAMVESGIRAFLAKPSDMSCPTELLAEIDRILV